MERYKDGEGKGDPNCPRKYVSNDTSPSLNLGVWLRAQRQARKGNGDWKISDERIHRLEELGVWWDKPDPQESTSLPEGAEDVTHLKRTTI